MICLTDWKTHSSCWFISVCSYHSFTFSSFLYLLTCILLVLFPQISSARDENDLTKSLKKLIFCVGVALVRLDGFPVAFHISHSILRPVCWRSPISGSAAFYKAECECFERGVLSCTTPINCRLFQKFHKNQFYGARELCQQQSPRGRGSHNFEVGGVPRQTRTVRRKGPFATTFNFYFRGRQHSSFGVS